MMTKAPCTRCGDVTTTARLYGICAQCFSSGVDSNDFDGDGCTCEKDEQSGYWTIAKECPTHGHQWLSPSAPLEVPGIKQMIPCDRWEVQISAGKLNHAPETVCFALLDDDTTALLVWSDRRKAIVTVDIFADDEQREWKNPRWEPRISMRKR